MAIISFLLMVFQSPKIEPPEIVALPPIVVELPAPPYIPTEECSCIDFVRKLLVKQFPKVAEAKEIPIVSDKPSEGSVAVFNYEPNGHAAFVTKAYPDKFEIREFNFKKCQETKRVLKYDDPFLLGFYR